MTPQVIAHYRITGKLGEGGMGVVYRATDTKLGRDVAIKVIPEIFAQDADRMARFAREAQVLAALNHPNIAAIYGVEDRALIMELVEGPTLAERIGHEPIPLAEALPLARQIAEALEYAHEKGIVHRDLKPANIKVTADGKVKLLDFGLAKALGSEAPAGDAAASPTLTMRATLAGVIMGTAAYMSPEQARGGTVDRRADIWAFGVVLYEMLTGRQMFAGESVSDTLAAVLRADPDWSALPEETPSSIRRLLRRCLERDRKRRLRDIGDALVEIDEALAGEPEAVAAQAAQSRWWAAAAILFALLGLVLAVLHFREAPPPEPAAVRFQIPLPEKTGFNRFFSISPDGRRLAFAATGPDGHALIWVRPLDSQEARPLPGTDGAGFLFWSPDSRFIGYWADGKLRKIEASGGSPQTLCDTSSATGAWNRAGVIIFGAMTGGGLSRVSAAGGAATALTKPDPSDREAWPAFLPDGRHFVYLVASLQPEKSGAYVAELDSKLEVKGSRRLIGLQQNVGVSYAPSAGPENGYLLFLREPTLMAQAFDVRRFELTGEAVPVAEQVLASLTFGNFGVSSNGVLVYRTGSSGGGGQPGWFDREGKYLSAAGPSAMYNDLGLSPDGVRVAVTLLDSQTGKHGIWLLDPARGTSTRFTFQPMQSNPVWSPDGGRIAFASAQDGLLNIYQKSSSGVGNEEALLQSSVNKRPTDWSRDGRFLLYTVEDPKTGLDLWVLPLDPALSAAERKPAPYLHTRFRESQGQFSPDGHWVAYTSDESGRAEVYVQPFPASGGRWQISTTGGVMPRWRGDGKELFYLAADRNLMAVETKTAGKFEAGVPRALFVAATLGNPSNLNVFRYSVSADGKRFLIMSIGDKETTSIPFSVVLNWQAGLKK